MCGSIGSMPTGFDIAHLPLVSADAHVAEPRDLWRANLPQDLHQQAMAGITAQDDGGWELLLDSEFVPGATDEEDRVRVNDPIQRMQVMREEGIAAECVFPTVGLYVWMLTDPVGGRISCRIYNEWILDQLARVSPRFACAGLVPTWDVGDAIAEVHWIAEHGLAAPMLPVVSNPTWNHPQWEPLWSAIEEVGLPVVMHQGTGHDMLHYRGPGAAVSNLLATQSMAPRAAALLATSGVLERHPRLHVAFVEFNSGWMAWTAQTLDFYQESFSAYGTEERPWIRPTLAEPPSFYISRQLHSTFQDDPVGVRNWDLTGPGTVLWGNDFPHGDGVWPDSIATINEQFAGLSPVARRAICFENACRVYGFSSAARTD